MPDQGAHPTVTLIVRAVLTAALMTFAFFTEAGDVSALIIGAVVGYWLREGEGQARRRHRTRSGAGVTGTGADTSNVTDTPERI